MDYKILGHEINTDIPMPETRRGRNRKFPFYDMSVGDSVFLPGMSLYALSGTRAYLAKKHNIKLIMQTEDNGVRVWRSE